MTVPDAAIPAAAMTRFTTAEGRLYPMVMVDPVGYQHATSLVGLVKHLANSEYGWFCETFGRPHEPLTDISEDIEADMRAAPGETTQEIVDFYRRSWTAADASVRELGLDATGTSYAGTTVSMRWVLVHMIEDTVRHAGHADIIRELVDGGTGHHLPPR